MAGGDDIYQEIRVKGDFTEYDRELTRRQSSDPTAIIGSRTFGSEGARGLLPSPEAMRALPAQQFGGPLTASGPTASGSASERLDASINRLAAVLESAAGGGLARATGMTRSGGRGGGGGWSGDENIDAEWSPVAPPPQIGGPQTGGAGFGGPGGGGGGPGGTGGWGQNAGWGGGGAGGGAYGPNPHWWYNKWGPRASALGRTLNTRLPGGNGLFFNLMFGAWETQQARHALQSSEFAWQTAESDITGLEALGQGIDQASRGPMASMGALAMDAIGFSNSPLAIDRMIAGEKVRSGYLNRAQTNMTNIAVGNRRITASDAGGIMQKMEEAKVDRDLENAQNQNTVNSLNSARNRLESTASSPEAFAALDTIGVLIASQTAMTPFIQAKYDATVRQNQRAFRGTIAGYQGQYSLAIAQYNNASPSAQAMIQLQSAQAVEMSQAGFVERMVLPTIHAAERDALQHQQDLETKDIGFDLTTRDHVAQMRKKGDTEEQVSRFEFSRRQQFEMEQTVRNHPQNAMALQNAQASEREEFDRSLDLFRSGEKEKSSIDVRTVVNSLDSVTRILGVPGSEPLARRKAGIWAQYDRSMQELDIRKDLDGGQIAKIAGASERARDAQLAEADREHTRDLVFLDMQLNTSGQVIRARKARDPTGAQAANLLGSIETQMQQLSYGGNDDAASRVRDQGTDLFKLMRRDYLESFRGEQLDLREISVQNPRDQEDPTAVLGRIEQAVKDLAAYIPQAD